MRTKEEFEKMRDVAILDVDADQLVEMDSVQVDTTLPVRERIAAFIDQIKNPYCYKSNGMIIKVSFNSKGKSLEDCIREYIKTDCVMN